MQLRDLIISFKEEKHYWPDSPKVLLAFCEYKHNVGELDSIDYYQLLSTLHKNKMTHRIH